VRFFCFASRPRFSRVPHPQKNKRRRSPSRIMIPCGDRPAEVHLMGFSPASRGFSHSPFDNSKGGMSYDQKP
jgi:hypothetical protein